MICQIFPNVPMSPLLNYPSQNYSFSFWKWLCESIENLKFEMTGKLNLPFLDSHFHQMIMIVPWSQQQNKLNHVMTQAAQRLLQQLPIAVNENTNKSIGRFKKNLSRSDDELSHYLGGRGDYSKSDSRIILVWY